MSNMKSTPAISVIIPIYNRVKLLLESLESILGQSFRDFEVLLIDDGSSAENFQKVRDYLESRDDPRFNLLEKPKTLPKGANSSRAYGFTISRGRFVKWFDSDDLMHRDFLKIQYEAISDNNLDGVLANCGIYNHDFTRKRKISWRQLVFSEEPLVDYLKTRLAWPTPAGLWKKKSIEHIRPFSQDVQNGQEWIFHLYVLTTRLRVGVIDQELIKIRSHPDSVSKNKTEEYTLNRVRTRMIALTRLFETGNEGSLFVLKSLYVMIMSLQVPSIGKVFLAALEEFKFLKKPKRAIQADLILLDTPEKKSLENDFHNDSHLQQSTFNFQSHPEHNKTEI